MTNRIRNEISHTIGNNSYTFRATFNTIIEFESVFDDKTIHTILANIIAEGITCNQILGILKAGLKGAEQPYDEKQLSADVEISGLNNAAKIVVELLTIALNGGKQFEAESQASKKK